MQRFSNLTRAKPFTSIRVVRGLLKLLGVYWCPYVFKTKSWRSRGRGHQHAGAPAHGGQAVRSPDCSNPRDSSRRRLGEGGSAFSFQKTKINVFCFTINLRSVKKAREIKSKCVNDPTNSRTHATC